jgi:hypothetical protein
MTEHQQVILGIALGLFILLIWSPMELAQKLWTKIEPRS